MSASQPAFAQDAADCADANENGVCDSDENTERAIVVTGSRIARPTLESSVPLTSITPGELTDGGDVSLGDALNDLPSLRSTFSQGNSTRFIGTAGLNILDLRGLGTARTLVLVNGKRHITASPGDYLVDVNTIPVDLLERVDVVTGGNSAIYGSDAVAGVVNFITKRNFDGINLRAQGGVSSRGDRGNYFISGTWGKNFADGRGNIAVSAEYAQAEPLYFTDRPNLTGAYAGRAQYNLSDVTAGEPAAGDGIPDNLFYPGGVYNASIADGGFVGPNASAATCATLAEPARSLRCLPSGQPRIFSFNRAGNQLTETTPLVDFRPFASGNVIPTAGTAGTLSTLRNTGQLAAGLKRYAVNLLGHFDVSEAFRPFIEAKFVHVDAIQEGQPSFFQGGTLGTFSCSNPFLTATAFAQLQSIGRCATPANTFAMSRFNTDFGGRGEIHDRDTYRVVAGVEGNFNDDWRYEAYVNYGRLETKLQSLNNLLLTNQEGTAFDGYLLAYDAVLAPVGYAGTNFVNNHLGQKVVCRVNADASTANDSAGCVPLNLFGVGNADPRAIDFSNVTALREEKAEELVIGASLSGDLSQLFELPGGPIGFAFGAEYREEKAESIFDALTASGATFLNAIQPFTPPKLTVKEVYGEVLIPLLSNMAFAEELSLSGAIRFSDYNTSAGTTTAYNLGGIYAPIPDIRFRVNYSKSVRVPTQSDLFSPLSQNFAQIQDPCDVNFIGNDPDRVRNCGVNGANVPVGFINTSARSQTQSFLSGGNPGLTAETGKSFTAGVVLEPSFVPGLSLTVDYYRIVVDRLIAAPGLQALLNLCFDSSSDFDDNPYCSVTPDDTPGLYDRNADGTFGDFVGNAVGVNFAGQRARGIDFDLAYRRTFDNGHRLSLRGIATYVLERTNFTDIINPTSPDRIKSELGDPEWAANFSANYDFGELDLTYTARYIGKQTIGTWESMNAYNGLPPLNADQFDRIYYPDALYHNFRASFEVDKKYNFYVGIDNAFDKKPPLGLLGTGAGDPFDTFGRYFYAGIRANW